MTEKQFVEITEWQRNTFGQATALSKISHLAQELQELVADLKTKSSGRFQEFADCFILLFGAAASDGMSYEDICHHIEAKMQINKTRKWGQPDENGVVNHIKE